MKRLCFFNGIDVFLCRHDLTLGIHPSKHDSFLRTTGRQVIIYAQKRLRICVTADSQTDLYLPRRKQDPSQSKVSDN